MAYLALYRKWRPKKFEDIVGQEHISRTLQNALTQNRIAHAYLFSGLRGTGKTSSAKVFAKGVNCLNSTAGEPCDECVNCQKINDGSSLDVFEIDAASNRGVDEIRELRERVKFAPTEGKYKIYIIDEVHMLTTEAFNALLKTLEEPPANVIFILATTEPHKIPLTILSRCQRFDFRPIGIDKIIERLQYICEQNRLEVEPEALKIIAKAAEGGMRDALSTLDQCISLGGSIVTSDTVNSILGVVNEEILYDLVESIIDKKIEDALFVIDQVVKEGKNLQQFIKDLISGFRNLLVLSISDNREDLIIASTMVFEKVKACIRKTNKRAVMQIIDILTDAEKELKWTNQSRLMLELAVIKACSLQEQVDVTVLMEKIEQLQFELQDIKSTGLPAAKPNKEKQSLNPLPKNIKREESIILENGNPKELDEVKKLWPKILEFLKKKDKMQVQAFLVEASPLHFDGKTLILGFEHAFHRDQVEIPKNKSLVEETFAKGLKKTIQVKCMLNSQVKSSENQANEQKESNLVSDAQKFFGQNVIIQVQD